MDWINGIQRAIDYTEEHLCEETDFEMIAKQAASLHFTFSVFSVYYAVIRWVSISVCGA